MRLIIEIQAAKKTERAVLLVKSVRKQYALRYIQQHSMVRKKLHRWLDKRMAQADAVVQDIQNARVPRLKLVETKDVAIQALR